MNNGRMKCCIMFCNRTVSLDKGFNQWICGVHYKFVPPKLKALRRRAVRKALKDPTERNVQRCWRLWERCKEKAMMRGL